MYYQFTEDCLTGIHEIDEEHQQLFAMINEASEMLEQRGVDPGSILTGVKELIATLKAYAATHFTHEESYMKKICDPELDRQREEHAKFTQKVNGYSLEGLEALGTQEAVILLEELLQFLARWLYQHILGSDIMIGKFDPRQEKRGVPAFTEKYLTGIDLVDEEHRYLFQLLEETDEIVHAEHLYDKYDELVRILSGLKEYTVKHFQDEEDYMERIGYDGIAMQKTAHQTFVDKLEDIDLKEMDDDQQGYLEDLVDFLTSWLVNHILKMDKRIPLE